VATAIAYGGMWWLGRQLGVSRWVAHLPAVVVVTAAYYLTDAYARGAWPELVALSAVPLFLAGAARLLTGPWRAGPVALFVLASVILTGSHNVTLLWGVLVVGPIALVAWIAVGRSRPSLRAVAGVVAVGALSAGVNAWFLLLDIHHSTETQAWIQNTAFLKEFTNYFYFDNLGVVLDPLRRTPAQSTTYGLAIGAPVAAFVLSLVLAALARPQLGRAGRALRVIWLILLAAMVVLVGLMVMPGSWWISLGAPFTDIQFPYRLAGWLTIAIAVQLAISLRFARGLGGRRRQVAVGLALALVFGTLVQASTQMYSGARLDNEVNKGIQKEKNRSMHPREVAFANGPSAPPETWYDPYSYADSSLPEVVPAPERAVLLPNPAPGQTRLVANVELPPGSGPIATNIAAGIYVVKVRGMRVVGRTAGGMLVVNPANPDQKRGRLIVEADAGWSQTLATIVSILCLIAVVGLIAVLALRARVYETAGRSPGP
jgi:hypothetical protein